MRSFHGQILRMLGLLIEMLGILGLAQFWRTGEGQTPFPAFLSLRLAWIVVGVGFAIWLFGSILIYWPRSRRSASNPEREEEKY